MNIAPVSIQRIIKRKLRIEQCPFNATLAELGAKEGHLQIIINTIHLHHNAVAKNITLNDSIYTIADKINGNAT